MGSIKDNFYLNSEIEFSMLGRAMAHPARVKIIAQLLVDESGVRNVDLTRQLGFSKSTVKGHLDMLKDAEILRIEYHKHYYLIQLNEKGRKLARRIFNE